MRGGEAQASDTLTAPEAGTGDALSTLAVADVTLPPPLPGMTRMEWRALALATTVHVVMFVPLLLPDDRNGGGGYDFEAIGVEIVTRAPALEARSTERGRSDAASDAVVRDKDGSPQPAPEETETRDSRQSTEPRSAENAPPPADLTVPEWQKPPEPTATPTETRTTEPVIAPQQSTGQQPDAETPLRPTVTEQPVMQTASIPGVQIVPQQEGGAAARGRELADITAAAMEAARAGRRDAYAMAVRAAIRANAPYVRDHSGIATVEFTIAPDGAARRIRVLESSGNPHIDRAAVAAVQGARFPPRPVELTGRSLVYKMPLTFKQGAQGE